METGLVWAKNPGPTGPQLILFLSSVDLTLAPGPTRAKGRLTSAANPPEAEDPLGTPDPCYKHFWLSFLAVAIPAREQNRREDATHSFF